MKRTRGFSNGAGTSHPVNKVQKSQACPPPHQNTQDRTQAATATLPPDRSTLLFFGVVLFALAMSLIILTTGQGAGSSDVFYVSLSGDDTNPGTQNQPWRTIRHAAASLTTGQTVIIESGDYGYENVVLRHSGTETKPITLKTDGGEVKIGYIPEGQREPNLKGIGIYASDESYVIVEGITIFDYPVAVHMFRCNDVNMKNLDIDTTNNEALFLDSCNNNTFENIKIRKSKSLDIFLGASNGNTFRNIDTIGEIILNPYSGDNFFE